VNLTVRAPFGERGGARFRIKPGLGQIIHHACMCHWHDLRGGRGKNRTGPVGPVVTCLAWLVSAHAPCGRRGIRNLGQEVVLLFLIRMGTISLTLVWYDSSSENIFLMPFFGSMPRLRGYIRQQWRGSRGAVWPLGCRRQPRWPFGPSGSLHRIARFALLAAFL
jgi:hypothetical protein